MGKSPPRGDDVTCDLIILGGGIAGLWTLHRAVQSGYRAILLEKDRLGGGQTIRSQGIIHGGVKYALHGALTTASNAIREMPAIWRACLAGSGPVDLRGVQILSNAHYLCLESSLAGRMAGFFAGHALRGRIAPVPTEARPGVFRNDRFRGAVYRLNEPVLETRSLVERLAEPLAHRIFRAGPDEYRLETREGKVTGLKFPAHSMNFRPRRVVLCCGEGYAELAERLSLPSPRMQRRPLHMVMAKFPQHIGRQQAGSPLYVHYLSGGPRPLITITTHYTEDHATIWYMGGELAESGIGRKAEEQIEKAKSILHTRFPWVDLQGARWATLRADRAEPQQSTLTRPDSAFVEARGNLIIAWPTKLALAPDLAEKVMAHLPPAPKNTTLPFPPAELAALPRPAIAEPAWEAANWETAAWEEASTPP